MSEHPSPECLMAEIAYRQDRVRQLFCGGVNDRMAEQIKERKRLQEEARATRAAYQRRHTHANEIAMIRAEEALRRHLERHGRPEDSVA